MASSTVENYIKQIYLEQKRSGTRLIPMGKLASLMQVAPGTATSMIKTLDEAELVEYEPRTGVRLTRGGRRLALHVLRRHRLVELFLVEVVGLDWSEVHDEAEQLEHVISDRVLERMDHLLGRPSVDPHGDPIPSSKGVIDEEDACSLLDCSEGEERRVARILDQDPEFLQFIERSCLTPGTAIRIQAHDKQADALTVLPQRHNKVHLGAATAAKILVHKN